ncbi:hypothetical protein BBP40_003758 [Aspergillus hancockii]|nr:hypothetical protein BBP40_003758 [Aspergillus hancockii]
MSAARKPAVTTAAATALDLAMTRFARRFWGSSVFQSALSTFASALRHAQESSSTSEDEALVHILNGTRPRFRK